MADHVVSGGTVDSWSGRQPPDIHSIVHRRSDPRAYANGHAEAAQQILDDTIEWHLSRPEGEQQELSYRTALASLYYEAKRWEEALTLYEEINREHPDAATLSLGCLAARMGDREESLFRISRIG